MFTDPVDRAGTLALAAHEGQVDKQGRDYFKHHLIPVAELLRPFGADAYAAGLLHDIIEDTDVTYDDLRARGIPEEVIGAVRSVTRRPGETYAALIERAAAHPLGRLVKLADNWLNMSGLDDLAKNDPAAASRLSLRYSRAREVLERSISASAEEAR